MPLWLKYHLGGVANPLTLGLLALVVILHASRRRPVAARRWGLGVILSLWMVATPQMVNLLALPLESQYPPIPVTALPQRDVIIVLGGAVKMPDFPRLEVELGEASDRVLYALRLYQAGRAPRILLSGGGFPEPEAAAMASLLQTWGVPAEALMLETKSLSTRENALQSQQIMNRFGLHKAILVTSALHMPRALATFRTAGLDVIPATTDVNISIKAEPFLVRYLPDPGAMAGVTQAVRERAAFWLYRSRGWIRSP
ncbi:MAG: YdcF family protein [Magnetococcus sp. DMHC-1]|nr:YdcF family protein [Magnetococcales bacterium]